MFYPIIVYLLKRAILVIEWSSFVILTMLLIIRMNVVSAYMIDSVSLWHGRLAHIGISTMKKTSYM